jgi:hypothetical protein
MSALGQKRTRQAGGSMSGVTLIADVPDGARRPEAGTSALPVVASNSLSGLLMRQPWDGLGGAPLFVLLADKRDKAATETRQVVGIALTSKES